VKIIELAKKFRIRPQIIYAIVRDFEVTGKIQVKRSGRSLILSDEAVETVEEELIRRGYYYGNSKEFA